MQSRRKKTNFIRKAEDITTCLLRAIKAVNTRLHITEENTPFPKLLVTIPSALTPVHSLKAKHPNGTCPIRQVTPIKTSCA